MSRTKNIIPEFTKDEQDYIKEHANFMEEESLFFELRNKQYTYEYFAMEMGMCVSAVKKVPKKTMNKITRVIRHMDICFARKGGNYVRILQKTKRNKKL